MADWGIDRCWLLTEETGESEVGTLDLSKYQACGLLGTAGLGKSYELDRLAELLRNDGKRVLKRRFVEIGFDETGESLRTGLSKLSAGLDANSVLLLDALDEAKIRIRRIGVVVADWIENDLKDIKPALFISCRSAVWPPEILTAIKNTYTVDVTLAALQPLSIDQQLAAARAEGMTDPEVSKFLEGIASIRAEALANQPLTLKLLIGEFKSTGNIPSNRCDLFEQAVIKLVEDRKERHLSGGVLPFERDQLIQAAELLACLLLLSDRHAISLDDNPSPGCLRHHDLSGLPSTNLPLDFKLLEAISQTGLFESGVLKPIEFVHRMFAEYLAGRRLARLPFHQSRALLASPAGWQAGVAGSLRETSAIAANLNSDLAHWIAETDPEVIGVSEVAESVVRRTAALQLLQQCRDHHITDMQFHRGDLSIDGMKYAEAEADLKPVLRERSADNEDVLDCAVRMVREWNIQSLCPELADLMLDPSAPINARKDAGHALLDIGSPEVFERIKALITDDLVTSDEELKGIALRANWPDNLTCREVLAALSPRQRQSFHGNYAHFQWRLVEFEFDAAGCRISGLRWAYQQFSTLNNDFEPLYKIAQKILHSALNHLGNKAVAREVLKIIEDSSRSCRNSPFRAIRDSVSRKSKDQQTSHPLKSNQRARHQLIELLISRLSDSKEYRWIITSTPGLRVVSDFQWLVNQALDHSLDMDIRQKYAEFARFLPWMDNFDSVEFWHQHRGHEPITAILNVPLFLELDSEEAKRERENHEMEHGKQEERDAPIVDPPPEKRVLRMLTLAEDKNPLFFRRVCEEMSLRPDSTIYGFERFLTSSPGWATADADTRLRIVAAAKAYLLCEENTDPEAIKKSRLNTIHTTAIAAIWLVQDQSPDWLDNLPNEWWQRWTWLLLREMHLHMHDEPDEAKHELFGRLHQRAGDQVRERIRRLAVGQFRKQTEAAHSLLASTLDLFDGISDDELDDMLCRRIARSGIVKNSLRDVTRFVLRRRPVKAAAVVIPLVREANGIAQDDGICEVVVALFLEDCNASWNEICEFLKRNSHVTPALLAQFASGRRLWPRRKPESVVAEMSPAAIGQLVELLFQYYPPDKDPKYDGAHGVSPADEARSLRGQLLNLLSEQKESDDALRATQRVTALRNLESKFGSRFAWLRRPRAKAERDFRLQHRKAIPLTTIAEILYANDRRLIRHDSDALDGVQASLEILEREAQHSSPSVLNRFWNPPTKANRSPREEEFVSDEICLKVREYFDSFAVIADREVQLYRRNVPKGKGGKPGSKVDIYASLPRAGTVDDSRIEIPIEIKGSYDARALDAMKNQLADRYMNEAGTAVGVYVLAWFNAPGIDRDHQPKWDSIDIAQAELEQQAKELRDTQNLDIRVVVIDLSLKAVDPSK